MMSDSPATECAKAISKSLRGFTAGMIGLIPFVGLPFAVHAYFQWKRKDRSIWNPASRYATAGAVLGGIGVLLSIIVMGLICAMILQNSENTVQCSTNYG